ncbi:MAG: hypothetical protein WCA81_06220 [Rhizomicrobium sp.]
MRDFLKAQLALLIGLAVLLPGGTVAVLLASAIHAEFVSILVFFSTLALVGWGALKLLQRLGLYEDDVEFVEVNSERFDWLGLIPRAIFIVVTVVAVNYWIGHSDAVFIGLKPRVGWFFAFLIVGPGAFALWLLLMMDTVLVFNLITGRGKRKPRHPDLRDWR